MEQKQIDSIRVLKYTLHSTLKSLLADTGQIPMELMQKAAEFGVDPLTPQIWQYSGSDGNPETKFQLDICLPIADAAGDPGKFQVDQLSSFKCLAHLHRGAWSNLGLTYQNMMSEMASSELTPTFTSREVYLKCDMENEANCLTEVQIEVK
jgi:effector-binding domain-containing protein